MELCYRFSRGEHIDINIIENMLTKSVQATRHFYAMVEQLRSIKLQTLRRLDIMRCIDANPPNTIYDAYDNEEDQIFATKYLQSQQTKMQIEN